MRGRALTILFIDGGAACSAGVAVLLLRDQFVRLHGFSASLLLFLGIANVAYASYSGSLAMRAALFSRPPSRRAIDVLIAANIGWVACCTWVLSSTWSSATAWGRAHVAFEAAFVLTLAGLEWRIVRPQSG